MLQKKFEYSFTSRFEKEYTGKDIDYRKLLNTNLQHPPPDIFTEKSYAQNFGKLFAPNLSILDVIFCEGPNALDITLESTHGT